ncbi:immunity 53 family protein [Hymenobacter cellulosivorans]|uniref:Immunity 53 family protein n=1 Tax=Hymenobacter cellulosivorans TaxID=2932249 RepID=A0ABY4FBJ3_9BACT|nr:immunity 53 family protein [Hymenobacter cellulosivorans]UOQ53884.1 immunity 53 family protein [Hymenobacter cellulosivorans]
MKQANILTWIQNWYLSQCDGEWEHEYGVKIETLDNPGWWVRIDLAYTDLEDIRLEVSVGESADDWHYIKVVDKVFDASGDPTKLEFLLNEFRALAEFGEEAFLHQHTSSRVIPIAEGFTLDRGLPKPIGKLLEQLIEAEGVTAQTMPDRGRELAHRIKPALEELAQTSDTDMDRLLMLTYNYGWNYIYSRQTLR